MVSFTGGRKSRRRWPPDHAAVILPAGTESSGPSWLPSTDTNKESACQRMFFGIPFCLLQTLINLSESHIPGLLLSFYEVTRSFDYSNFDFRNTSERSIVVKIHESVLRRHFHDAKQ